MGFAKQTYGIFGTQVQLPAEDTQTHLEELYQGLCNLPLMTHTSKEWAQMQLCNDDIRMFYNDIHEYHCYMVLVPYVDADVLGKISKLVDGGKRSFKWLSPQGVKDEVLAPRLHTDSFMELVQNLPNDEYIIKTPMYGAGSVRAPSGTFAWKTVVA